MHIKVHQRPLYELAKSNINVEKFVVELNKVHDLTKLPLQVIVDQVMSPGGNSVLHAAARFGNKDITGYLIQEFPHLIVGTNYAGDTALHSAAEAGKVETIKVLLQCRTNPAASSRDGVPLLRMKNLDENTALHDAVIHCNFAAYQTERESYCAVAACMVSVDSELAYIANSEKESPLYLAVETTDFKILQCLLEYPLPAAGDPQLPEGKSPVHVAIQLKKHDKLKEMLDRRSELINSINENGRKALHCAASVGNMEAINFLLQMHPEGIYERDNEGLYPLHVACESGYVKAFDKLFHQWPDTLEFLNNKCQNVLHVAAENDRDYMVRHIVKDQKLGRPELVNAEDIEGNTPLHLATLHGHSLVVGTLLLTRKCDSQILNKKGLTAYKVAKERTKDPMDSGRQMPINEQREVVSSRNTKPPDSPESMMVLSTLFFSQLYKILRDRSQQQRMRSLWHEMEIKKPSKEDIKDWITRLLVVATIVPAIAFQAIVQMPGSDKGGSSKTSVTSWFGISNDKTHLTYLRIYIFFNYLAMNLAIFAAITLCWVHLIDVNVSAFLVGNASILVGGALSSIGAAFGFALLITIRDFGPPYAAVMICLEVTFILVLSMLTIPLFIPFKLKHLFVRGFYAIWFILYFMVQRLLDCCLSPKA